MIAILIRMWLGNIFSTLPSLHRETRGHGAHSTAAALIAQTARDEPRRSRPHKKRASVAGRLRCALLRADPAARPVDRSISDENRRINR